MSNPATCRHYVRMADRQTDFDLSAGTPDDVEHPQDSQVLAPRSERTSPKGRDPCSVPRWHRAVELGSGRTERMPDYGLAYATVWTVERQRLAAMACGLWCAAHGRRLTCLRQWRGDVARATARQAWVRPALSGIDRRAEEARLACLVHDFERSVGTIVFWLVVSASVLFPDTALLAVSRTSHYKR